MHPVQQIYRHIIGGETMTATRFAPVVNIFTGQDVIEVVPIPSQPARGAKGTTLHDERFDKLMDFKQALKVPEHSFGGMRKALQRYIDNHGLRKKVSMRQKKDYKTKSYTIWLVNEPPKAVTPRSEK
jgi:hypothetical protein